MSGIDGLLSESRATMRFFFSDVSNHKGEISGSVDSF